MVMTLLLRTGGSGEWHEPVVTAYQNEAHLQEIILGSPQLLPAVPTPAVTAAEFATSEDCLLDVLCVSYDGTITLCECKLRKNPEIKRWIVGQLFAYASGLWRLSYDELDQRVGHGGAGSLESRMRDLLAAAGAADWDATAFRAAVTLNLARGRFRLIFAVDEITEELRRTVEFLNVHTTPGLSILALEVGYVEDGDVQVLVPKVYGAEIASQKEPIDRVAWDRDSFLDALKASRGESCADTVKTIMDWAADHGASDRFGTGKKYGSWYPTWQDGRGRAFSAWTDGMLSIDVWSLRGRDQFDEARFLQQLRERLAVTGLFLTPAKDSPSVQTAAIEDTASLHSLLEALAWVLEQPS